MSSQKNFTSDLIHILVKIRGRLVISGPKTTQDYKVEDVIDYNFYKKIY